MFYANSNDWTQGCSKPNSRMEHMGVASQFNDWAQGCSGLIIVSRSLDHRNSHEPHSGTVIILCYQLSAQYTPTPLKRHYRINPRDAQGIFARSPNTNKSRWSAIGLHNTDQLQPTTERNQLTRSYTLSQVRLQYMSTEARHYDDTTWLPHYRFCDTRHYEIRHQSSIGMNM